MASPTLTKTWAFDVNNLPNSGNATTNAQSTLRGIKDKMKTLSSNPWTVAYSATDGAAGVVGDGVDRWAANTDLVWSAGNHSWIVLKQTAIASNFQICIDLAGVQDHMAFIISPSAGFTGGSIGARPTATDEYEYRTSGKLWGRAIVLATTIVGYHVMMSSDGECTRVLFTQNDKACGCWIIDKLQNPPSGLSIPAFVMINAANGTDPGPSLKYSILRDGLSASDKLIAYAENSIAGADPSFSNGHMTSEGCRVEGSGGANGDDGGGNVSVANEINGEWEIYPIGFGIRDRPNKGKMGTIADLWFLPNDQTDPGDPAASGSCVTGTTLNPSGTQDFVVMDVILFPWDGSVPIVSGTYAGGKPPIDASIPQTSNFTEFTSKPGTKSGSRIVTTTEGLIDPSIKPSGSYDRQRTNIKYPYGRRRPRIGDFSEG